MTTLSLVQAARRMAKSLQKETALARMGSLAELAEAAEAKKLALEEFSAACAARGGVPPATEVERAELRRLLAQADENALILEAVRSTIQHWTGNLRNIAGTIADPGTYTVNRNAAKRSGRHVLAACVNERI